MQYKFNYLFVLLFTVLFGCKTNQKLNRTKHLQDGKISLHELPSKEDVWVFILAGQSNMAGRGQIEAIDTISDKRILTINAAEEIILAKEPLHFYEPTMAGLDCGLSFGKSLITKIPNSVSVLLIPTAVGGSSITKWLDDSTHRNVPLLTNFKEKVALSKSYGTIKGILWHQGESDANLKNVTLYQKRLERLLSTFREIIKDQRLPVFIGELGSYATNERWKIINEQINAYAASDSIAYVIKTSDLKDKGDKVHFNAAGQREIGKRFAQKYMETTLKNDLK